MSNVSRFILVSDFYTTHKIIVNVDEILSVYVSKGEKRTTIKFKNSDEVYSAWSPEAIYQDII